MPELRKDPIVGRWVIIADERAKRPHDFKSEAPPPLDPATVHSAKDMKTTRRRRSSRTATTARARTARDGEFASCPTASRRSKSKATSTSAAMAFTT